MTDENRPDQRGPILFLILLMMLALLTVAWGVGHPQAFADSATPPRGGIDPASSGVSPGRPSTTPTDPAQDDSPPPTGPTTSPAAPGDPATLPSGSRRVFGGHRFLVAYYGTAETGALGVLGETRPDEMQRRVHRAAAPFKRPGQPVQVVYELIVTIADRSAGPDGDYSHDIDRRSVARYIRAAHRHGALLLLDLQPGRSDFLAVAKRWAWALKDPWVGLALDPEWRLGPHLAPAQVVGHVRATEVNRTSSWLAAVTRRLHLPEKLFVLHQFRTTMIEDIARVRARRGLAMVQHVDGFGTRGEKMATYHAVQRAGQFTMGLKIFYDEDRDRMGPAFVHAIRPRVRFVSYQ
ncbi:hypothetical protein [Nocardioides sp.]|uniref:hypothetical protein n=1 Tax=Nocardioides sp. TaxID=35761 RepID=UPI0031FE572B|nr:hypothetical protein [Nocardioides sp.]